MGDMATSRGGGPLRIEPPIGMPFRVGGGFLQVRDESPKAPLRFEISPGAVVVLEAAEHFAGQGLVIVGLHDSSGTPAKVAEFAKKRGLTWALATIGRATASGPPSPPTGSGRSPRPR